MAEDNDEQDAIKANRTPEVRGFLVACWLILRWLGHFIGRLFAWLFLGETTTIGQATQREDDVPSLTIVTDPAPCTDTVTNGLPDNVREETAMPRNANAKDELSPTDIPLVDLSSSASSQRRAVVVYHPPSPTRSNGHTEKKKEPGFFGQLLKIPGKLLDKFTPRSLKPPQLTLPSPSRSSDADSKQFVDQMVDRSLNAPLTYEQRKAAFEKKDYYTVLEVLKHAPHIDLAYRLLARRFHPDKGELLSEEDKQQWHWIQEARRRLITCEEEDGQVSQTLLEAKTSREWFAKSAHNIQQNREEAQQYREERERLEKELKEKTNYEAELTRYEAELIGKLGEFGIEVDPNTGACSSAEKPITFVCEYHSQQYSQQQKQGENVVVSVSNTNAQNLTPSSIPVDSPTFTTQ